EIPEYIYGNRLTKAYKRTLADMVEGEGIHLKAAAYHSLGRLLYALKPRLSRSEGPPLGNSPDIPRTSSDFFSHNILEKCGVTVSQPEAVIWDGRPYKVHRKGRGRPFIRLREGGKIVRRYL